MDSTRMMRVPGLMGRITAAQTLGSAGRPWDGHWRCAATSVAMASPATISQRASCVKIARTDGLKAAVFDQSEERGPSPLHLRHWLAVFSHDDRRARTAGPSCTA
ncbi:hypothetical protein SCAR479_06499 [Seiridium cardinale]|uniref:Uncharacterized protein n=1 Tax=Seiridium cardinale TaxID=138064 RepID=A0ABR2XSH8_9PEZI